MTIKKLPNEARFKLDLMFDGIRFSPSMGEAAKKAFPNFYPYRFQKGEPDPTGTGKTTIPYLLETNQGTHSRIRGNGSSPWVVNGDEIEGYKLSNDNTEEETNIVFEPLPEWMKAQTSDGYPMSQSGVSVHGDMLVVNVAPGCEYFVAEKQNGNSMRCTFCAYGAPDDRSKKLGQVIGEVSLPDVTYQRMQETIRSAINEMEIRHIYLVGGSLPDPHQEGLRFIELAQKVKQCLPRPVPITCGSGAIPPEIQQQLFDQKLVDAVCFNLEIWSEPLFSKVCPGKNRFVGYAKWIEWLEHAVGLWGKERVYSAMVAGIELDPEYKLSWQEAAGIVLQGAEDLCSRGIIPIYSLYWPVGGREHPNYLSDLRNYFEKINIGYHNIRQNNNLSIWEGFMCHHCSYMQLECDIDREISNGK